ncbi:putative sugar kinase YdjH [Peptococcaceae bacterium CEB3]|nr:putative sugar kinase YdjH [Peptococcaceae bacterium CEB3]
MPQVMSFGILVADLLAFPVDKYPERGKLVLADEMHMSTGGGALNTALALKKLGFNSAVTGRVGRDGPGDYIVEALTTAGVDVQGIKRDKEAATSSCMVFAHRDGERSFIYSHGANARLMAKDVDFDVLEECEVFHVGYALVLPKVDGQAAAELLQQVKKRGCVTVVDTAWDHGGRWMESMAPYLPYTDIFLPSLNEAETLSKRADPREIAKYFLGYGVKTVGIKLGSRGSYVTDGKEEFLVPPFSAASVDGTGAGDSYVAGFIAATLKGWPLDKVATFANAVGALATTELGATAGVRDMGATLKFMETAGMSVIK